MASEAVGNGGGEWVASDLRICHPLVERCRRKELEQVPDRDAEAVGYLCQDVDGGIGFAVLDVREVGVVDPRHEAELAQGKFGGFSALPNGRTELYAVGFFGDEIHGKKPRRWYIMVVGL